jgi:cytidylate kinase
MEGRDIGSVVFPDTPYKFYIDASPEVREARRRAEGIDDSIAKRDKIDSSRKASPLVIPEDAVVVDSSEMGVDEVVEEVMRSIRTRSGS